MRKLVSQLFRAFGKLGMELQRFPCLLRRLLSLMLLLVLTTSSSGCNEEFLASLSPEQRAFFLSLSTNSSLQAANSTPPVAELSLAESSEQPEFTHSRLATDDLCQTLIPGPPRGLSCLHCTQPEARESALAISLLLFRSCLQSIAINYLVDGTFSFDQEIIEEQIELLTSNGRKLFVYFYLANGSSQRRWSSTPIDSFATRIEPAIFRDLIQGDLMLQFEYQLIATRLLPIIRTATELGAEVSLIPMLEDNLDRASFNKLYQLAHDVIPPDLAVTFGRNACPNCYPGNSNDTPAGLFSEIHLSHPYFELRDGVVSNDGKTYCYEQSEQQKCPLSLSDLASVRDKAWSLNNTFILWSAARQGLPTELNGVSRFTHPGERTYAVPSLAERSAIIEFLTANTY